MAIMNDFVTVARSPLVKIYCSFVVGYESCWICLSIIYRYYRVVIHRTWKFFKLSAKWVGFIIHQMSWVEPAIVAYIYLLINVDFDVCILV